MTTYYVDPAAPGENDGSSWTDAWTDTQSAFDTAVAADIVYLRGEQNLSASLDVDTNSGSNAGYIKFIGCNSSGVVDGTRFVLDGQDNAITGILFNGRSHIYLANFEAKNCQYGFRGVTNTNNYLLFNNCSAHDNSSHGFYGSRIQNSTYFRCVSYLNSGSGFYEKSYSGLIAHFFCAAHDNSAAGFAGSDSAAHTDIGCLSFDNTDNGFSARRSWSLLYNSIADGNGDDGVIIDSGASLSFYLCNRITNHSESGDIGLNANSCSILTLANYFENNDGNNIQNTVTGSIYLDLSGDGVSSNIEDQSNTNQGYTSVTDGSEDYNLRSDATLCRTAITIPLT